MSDLAPGFINPGNQGAEQATCALSGSGVIYPTTVHFTLSPWGRRCGQHPLLTYLHVLKTGDDRPSVNVQMHRDGEAVGVGGREGQRFDIHVCLRINMVI